MKRVLLLLLITIFAFGWEKFYPSFHAKVINVAKDDVLNIRSKPNYKSKKVGYLEPGEEMQIEYCLKGSKSTWCKIYPAVSINLGGSFNSEPASGFVNAKFLKFINNGYVNIKNRKSDCDYLVECKSKKCLILTYIGLEWVKRSLIGVEKGQKATSLPEEEGGEMSDDATFCFNHARDKELWKKVDEYYKKNKKSTHKNSKKVAKEVINALKNFNLKQFKRYIHPKRGITLSYFPDFYRVKKHFSKMEFNRFYNSNKRLYWGVSEGRGDKIYMSLKEYIKTLSVAAKKATKIQKSNPYNKGFSKRANLVAYDFREPSPHHGWKGVYVVLQKYHNRYYLVGLVYNRWEI
jgi:hypothetical protein